jgi:hypothetical protein
MEPLSLKSGSGVRTVNGIATDIEIESPVGSLFGNLFERGELTETALGNITSILTFSRLRVS